MPSKQGEHKVTSAMWSPVRPSVLLASRQDGYLMVKSRMYPIQYYSWYLKIFDVLYQQGPLLEVFAHDGSINCMASHETGSLICLGKDNGTVALMELSDGFLTSPNIKVK